MKTNLSVLAAASITAGLAGSINAHADGTVNFANDSSCQVINGVTLNPVTSAQNVKAALYWAPTNSSIFTQVGNDVEVGEPVDGMFAGGTRTTGLATPGGHIAQFQVRAWSGGFANFEQASRFQGTLIGTSAVLQVTTGNPAGDPPTPPASLVAVGLPSFTVTPAGAQQLIFDCSAPKSVVCDSTWSFDLPLISGGCTGATVQVLFTVTNGLCPRTITRNWSATDSCGQSNWCSQTVELIDTNAPVINCASSKAVACGAAWDFDLPTATEECGGTNVAVTVLATITNNICPLAVTRTWLATDVCGNTNTCSQTVTGLHLSPPGLICAISKFVNCTNVWHFDPPVAYDECGGTNAVVTVLDTVTNSLCPLALKRTWAVTNPCSTRLIMCSQKVTVLCPDCPVLLVTKSCPPNPVPPGGTLFWTGSLTNASDTTASNIMVLSDQPAPNTPVFGPVMLAAGEGAIFNGSYSVLTGFIGPHASTLTASGVGSEGVVFTGSATISCPGTNYITPGDMNGDGIVDQGELNAVLANYWPHSPWISMTNAALLCDGKFQFELTNAGAWNFTVLVSTNLVDWTNLPAPAFPVYQFTDPEGTNTPQRLYRLQWP